MIDVSIIVVNWNTKDILRDCLQSVYSQTKEVSFELIVVDNASADGSAEMVKNEFPEIILIKNEVNVGFGAANNQGMEFAKGRYILLLNPDTVILDGAIQKTIKYADLNPDAGVFGCKALWPGGSRQNTCFRFPTLLLTAWASFMFFRMSRPFRVPIFHPERYARLDFQQEHDVDVVAGCFFLVRKEVIQQVGSFDDEFFMYGEEAEWCYRIQKKGWKIRYFPGAEIIHIYGASSSKIEEETKINKRKGNILFLCKTKGSAHAWFGNFIMFIGVLIRLPFWLIEDIVTLVRSGGRQIVWNKRFRVVWFHFTGLFYPVWNK